VVAILLAATRIATGGLQMAERMRADPHFFAGGRNRQQADAIQRRALRDAPAICVCVEEGRRSLAALLAAMPANAGSAVGEITQRAVYWFLTSGRSGAGPVSPL
jgi:hypothetical protein